MNRLYRQSVFMHVLVVPGPLAVSLLSNNAISALVAFIILAICLLGIGLITFGPRDAHSEIKERR